MALKATIYKAEIHIADMDRHYFASHSLTIACHPSETEERLMVRLLAFALFASDNLTFTRGISTDDEPDLWEKDLTGHITHWIELGTPEESRIRKGCNRADRVTVISYGDRSAGVWWQKNRGRLERQKKLRIFHIADESTRALAAMVARNMTLHVSLQDGQVTLGDGGDSITLHPESWV